VAALNPSATLLGTRFSGAVRRSEVSCGDTIVYVDRAHIHDILAFLKTDPDQRYDYLTDITAVEYRDRERPLEVVYQLRSLARKVNLRVKVELPKDKPLDVATVTDLWQGANWMEREVWTCSASGSPAIRTCAAS